jgi:ribosomal protein L7/L12
MEQIMTSHDWLVVIGVYVATSILSGVLQARFSALDSNAKRLAYLERRVHELSKQLGIEEAPMTEVQELIAQGLKINAIKLYREQTGLGLAASKDAVESMAIQMKAQGLV